MAKVHIWLPRNFLKKVEATAVFDEQCLKKKNMVDFSFLESSFSCPKCPLMGGQNLISVSLNPIRKVQSLLIRSVVRRMSSCHCRYACVKFHSPLCSKQGPGWRFKRGGEQGRPCRLLAGMLPLWRGARCTQVAAHSLTHSLTVAPCVFCCSRVGEPESMMSRLSSTVLPCSPLPHRSRPEESRRVGRVRRTPINDCLSRSPFLLFFPSSP